MTEEKFTHTVHCFTNKKLRKHFESEAAAVKYANELLKKGEKAKIYPYRPVRRYIDLLAEEGPPPGTKIN